MQAAPRGSSAALTKTWVGASSRRQPPGLVLAQQYLCLIFAIPFSLVFALIFAPRFYVRVTHSKTSSLGIATTNLPLYPSARNRFTEASRQFQASSSTCE